MTGTQYSTKNWEAIINSLPDPVLVVRKDFSISFMNEAAQSEASRHGSELPEKQYCYQLSHGRKVPCSADGERCPVSEVFKTGKPSRMIHRHGEAGSGMAVIQIDAAPVFNDRGEVIEVVEINRNIANSDVAELLIATERRFRALFESSRDAIMLLDRTGFLDCNNATLAMFGCDTKDQFVLKHPGEFSPLTQPDGTSSSEAARNHIETAYAEGGRFFEWTHRRRNGSEFHAEVLLSRFDYGGQSLLQAVVRDVSERKAAERLMEENRATLARQHAELTRIFKLVEIGKREWEKSMDCVEDMVVLTDKEGSVKRCNKSFKEFMGLAYDELLGKGCIELLVNRGIEVDEFFNREAEVQHVPSARWFRIRSYPASGIHGPDVSGAVITIHDVTDIRRMHRKLKQSNQEIEEHRLGLQHALDELSALIQRVETEQTFDIRFNNPNLRKCYEVKNCIKTACPCHGKNAQRCWQIAGTHCGGTVQGDFAQKYGNCIECDVYRNAATNPIYQIGEQFNNMMNILENKNRELEGAYSELKQTQAKILQQEKMASIGQLAAGVAHEINNPTGFIMSNLGSLQKYLDRLTEFIRIQSEATAQLPAETGDAVARQRKMLKVDHIISDLESLVRETLEGAERIKKIVQDLKSFSRVDEAVLKMADINAGIESTINIVWNELKYKAALKKEYGELPQTKCNPGQLNQVFMNLLVNAAHAIEKQGTITIRTWLENDRINVAIADTGCGIPQKNIDRIFEPFFTTKEVGKGTGLGLSIAYDIVKKHDGTITVASEAGKGTTFTVTLPVVTA